MIVKTNKAQRVSIYRIFCQNNQGMTYREFRKTVAWVSPTGGSVVWSVARHRVRRIHSQQQINR